MKIPEPQLGLVVRFEYQWLFESAKGLPNGVKDRPAVVVMMIGDGTYVAPITTQKPPDLSAAIEIPKKVRDHLGLDDKPQWIICSEVNQFVWPGYDLRPLPHNPETCAYGPLPPALFNQVIGKMKFLRDGGVFRVIKRED